MHLEATDFQVLKQENEAGPLHSPRIFRFRGTKTKSDLSFFRGFYDHGNICRPPNLERLGVSM